MRPCSVEVSDIRAEDAPQVRLAEDENVVQALAPYAAQEPRARRIDARGADGGAQHADPARGGEAIEPLPILAIVVAKQEPWCHPEWRRLAQLLRHSSVGRVPRDADMDDAARLERDNEAGV